MRRKDFPLSAILKALAGVVLVISITDMYLWLHESKPLFSPFLALLLIVASFFWYLMGRAAKRSENNGY